MPDEPEPVELTEPVDVVAWLRALPVGTVLLDRDRDAWQLVGINELTFMCVDGSLTADVDSDYQMAAMSEYAPFLVLWTPGGGT